MKCYVCSMETDDICSVCERPICDFHTRVPDPDVHDLESYPDYCVNDYVREGYAEMWEIRWVNPQYGDGNVTVIDVEPGIHPFKIPKMASVPMNWAYKWNKVRP